MKTFRNKNEITKEVLKDESSKLSEELPIDAHMKRILSHIRSHRCTVIHGETGFHFFILTSYFMKFNFMNLGCGKSSRVPEMILRDCHQRNEVSCIVTIIPNNNNTCNVGV